MDRGANRAIVSASLAGSVRRGPGRPWRPFARRYPIGGGSGADSIRDGRARTTSELQRQRDELSQLPNRPLGQPTGIERTYLSFSLGVPTAHKCDRKKPQRNRTICVPVWGGCPIATVLAPKRRIYPRQICNVINVHRFKLAIASRKWFRVADTAGRSRIGAHLYIA